MNTFLWIFIAFAFGILLFTSLQEKLPDELSFLKQSAVVKTKDAAGWSVSQQGEAVELSYSMPNTTEGSSPAILGILCYKGALDVRLNPQVATTGLEKTPVSVSGRGEELWEKGIDNPQSKTFNTYPKQPIYFIKHILSNQKLNFTVSSISQGLQSYSLDSTALSSLLNKFDNSCQQQLR